MANPAVQALFYPFRHSFPKFILNFIQILSLAILLGWTFPSSAGAQTSLNARADFQGGVLRFSWDPVPPTYDGFNFLSWSVQVLVGFGYQFECGPVFFLARPCPPDQSNNHVIDLTDGLLSGGSPTALNVTITVYATYESPFSGARITPFLGFIPLTSLPTPPMSLRPASSEEVSGSVGERLTEPFVVEVERFGQSIRGGAEITWSIDQAPAGAIGQRVEPASVAVSSDGKAEAFLTLGSKEGAYQVRASCSVCDNGRGSSLLFKGNAHVNLKLEKESGEDGQSGAIGTPLPRPFVVKVVNAEGRGVSGQSVTFTITEQPSGATAASPQRSVTKQTGSDGTASATLTLGDKVGQYTVEVTCAECRYCQVFCVNFLNQGRERRTFPRGVFFQASSIFSATKASSR